MLLAAVQVTHGYDDYQDNASLDRAEIEQLEALFLLDPGTHGLKRQEPKI